MQVGRSSNQATANWAKRAGNDALVRDVTGNNARVASLLDHVQRAVAIRQIDGHAWMRLQKRGTEAADDALPKVDSGEDANVAVQLALIVMQALLGFLGQ